MTKAESLHRQLTSLACLGGGTASLDQLIDVLEVVMDIQPNEGTPMEFSQWLLEMRGIVHTEECPHDWVALGQDYGLYRENLRR